MTKIRNKYRLLSRVGLDIWGTLFMQRIKFKRLRGVRPIIAKFQQSRRKQNWDNLLLLDSSRGGKFVRRSRITQYGAFLRTQRSFRSFYDIRRETQFKRLANKALKYRNSYGSHFRFSELVEMRLDSLLWRARFGKDIRLIRQMIGHKKIYVNGKATTYPSQPIGVGDVIQFKPFFVNKNGIPITSMRRLVIQENFLKRWGRWTPPHPNFMDIDYKNFIITVNAKPDPIDLFYPFGGSLNEPLWFYGLKFGA